MKHLLTFITLGVVVVMALTFAAYVVLTKFRPEVEMRRMAIAMASLSSFSHDDGFSWSREQGGERVSTTLYASGNVQADEDENLEQDTEFRVIHISKNDDYTDLSGEVKTIGEKTYLTYAVPGPAVPGVSFDGDTWVVFDEGEIEGWGEIVPGLQAPLTFITPLTGWNPAAITRLRYMLALTDIVVAEYNGLTEIIDGTNTHIIDGRFDQDATEAFLLDAVRAKEGKEPEDTDRILAHTQAKQLARLTLRFWIGMDDHVLYRVQAAGGFVQEGSTDLIPVDARVDFSKFNEMSDIAAPSDAISFVDILHAVFPESAGASLSLGEATLLDEQTARLPVTTVEASDDQDGDGLDDILEAFYGTDRGRADTDGDGVSDGDEVRSGKNPRGKGSLFSFGLGL